MRVPIIGAGEHRPADPGRRDHDRALRDRRQPTRYRIQAATPQPGCPPEHKRRARPGGGWAARCSPHAGQLVQRPCRGVRMPSGAGT